MSRWRYLWLLVPALALGELVAHVALSRRAPRVEEWQELAEPVRRLKRPADLVVVAPEWAEPIARHAFGDAAFPLDQIARADASGFARALEVSALGARAEETRGWRVVSEEERGRFTLRVLENPAPKTPRHRLVDHVTPGALSVAVVGAAGEAGGTGEALGETAEAPCPFTDRARVSTGGLHGHVAYPRERFTCPGGEHAFVGVTVIDDEHYLPRRCIWAHPPARGRLRLRFSGVRFGAEIRAWAGLSYFLFRDGLGVPVTIAFQSGEHALGSHAHRDEWGFRAFTIPTPELRDTTAELDVFVSAATPAARHFCFVAETL